MRVLLVTPGPQFSVADVARGWGRALTDLGVDLQTCDMSSYLWFYSNAEVPKDDEKIRAFDWGQAVVEAGERMKGQAFTWWPDVVIVISGFFARPFLIDLFRARGMTTVLICTESPYQDQQQLEWAEHYDVTILNDPTNIGMFESRCRNVFYAGHSYDPRVHHPGPAIESLRSDVCMVGTGYPSRIGWLERVDWSGVDLRLGGNWKGLADHPLRAYCPAGELDQCLDNDETADWYRSTQVGLNLYRKEADEGSTAFGYSMGPREIELAACGTFYMTEARPENRELLPFVPVVESPEQFREDLGWWLDRPQKRADIAQKAREMLAGWTFENRARTLLGLLDRQPVTL